jgi:hypothetical protein
MGKRVFKAEGDLLANSSSEYWRLRLDMMTALMPRPQFNRKIIGTLDLLFTGFSEHVTSEVTLDGYPEIPMEAKSPSAGRYMVAWKSFDPKLYGGNQRVDIPYNPAWQNLGGRNYDKTYDKTYAVASISPQQAIISNSGNIEVYPILVFYGPATNPRAIMARDDGAFFIFSFTGLVLSDVTDYVVVDMEKHTVTRSNGANLYSYAVGSDWFSFEPSPSQNVITFNADSTAVPAHMTIQWRNGYMI